MLYDWNGCATISIMKVFFSASISRRRSLLPITQDIVRDIETLGHQVINKYLIDLEYTKDPEWDKKADAVTIYNEEIERLKSADVLITECTTPSFGAGFFIDKCVELKKPLLSLHYGPSIDNATLMLRGRTDINLQAYDEDNIKYVLKKFLDSIPV
jgi:hypothetical protein